ncbi:MAG: thioredoxin domain-containing protein [Phycisphaerales bacterium]
MQTPSSVTLHPTVETFEQTVIRSPVPVLVDFWAPWCPPCQALKPELERLAPELAGRAAIAFINVDEQPQLAGVFGVSSIPALAIIRGGKVVDAWTGYTPRAEVLRRLLAHQA